MTTATDGGIVPETHAQIDIHAPPGIVFATLWDAARYPEFLTDVIDAHVDAGPSPTFATARLQQRIVREVELELAMQGEPNSLVTFRLRDGGGWLARYDGAWSIDCDDSGREVQLHLHVDVEFESAVPDAVVRRLFDFAVPTMLRQIKARAEMVTRRSEALVGW